MSVRTERQSGRGHAWTVLISLMCLYAVMSGVLNNTIGIFFSAIRTDLGFRAGDLSVYYMIKSFAAALTVSFSTRMFMRRGTGRKFMILLEVLAAGAFALMGTFTHLWQWYVIAAVAGFGQSNFLIVIPVVINNWFEKHRGLLVGLTVSISGVTGAVLSPILSAAITASGWRAVILVTGLVSLLVMLVPTLLFFYPTPEELGELPYGHGEAAEEAEQTGAQQETRAPAHAQGLILGSLLPAEILVCFAVQLPTFAASVGYDLNQAASMNSWLMIGNIIGKLIIGVLLDRIGVFRSAKTFLSVIGVSMLLYLTGQSSYQLLVLASFLYGAIYAISVNVQPALILEVYGPQTYQEKMSHIKSIMTIIMAFASIGFPYIYDFTGTFNLIFAMGIVFSLLSILMFGRLEKACQKVRAE